MFTHKYDSIINIENLLMSWFRFRRGKTSKRVVREFELNLGDNLAGIHQLLASKKYLHGGYDMFKVADPKPRVIHNAPVTDKIVHRLIYDTLYWHFHFRFIHDSYSCRKGKGPHKAIERFKKFAGQVSKNHTRAVWILKCDVKKFFASIDHARLKEILARHIYDQDLLWLCDQVIDSFDSGETGKGLPLGNLTSQLFGNIYMHEFDMFVKQELRVKHYIRYSDDFVLFSQDKHELEQLLSKIENFLSADLKLKLHENKVHIQTYASGVDFLGWVHFSKHRVLRTTTKNRLSSNLKWYPSRETVNSYRGLLGHGNTHKIKQVLENLGGL
ncbi:MAG: reverse transcriptase/maturase family protein [Patescibacteria group bacterium]